MALEFSICEVRWERYRRVAENPHAREWSHHGFLSGLQKGRRFVTNISP
jgi:hypothetical protein